MEARIARRKSKTREIGGEERHKRPSVYRFVLPDRRCNNNTLTQRRRSIIKRGANSNDLLTNACLSLSSLSLGSTNGILGRRISAPGSSGR